MARAGRVPGRGSTRGAMPPFWLAVPEIPGWAAGSSEAWSSNGSGDGNSNSNSNSNSGEAGARRIQPAHLLQVAGQTETAKRPRSEEHTSELQSLMRIPYAVFFLKNNPNH